MYDSMASTMHEEAGVPNGLEEEQAFETGRNTSFPRPGGSRRAHRESTARHPRPSNDRTRVTPSTRCSGRKFAGFLVLEEFRWLRWVS